MGDKITWVFKRTHYDGHVHRNLSDPDFLEGRKLLPH
jgi:hypothetical protein